jgi:hypothetical protein
VCARVHIPQYVNGVQEKQSSSFGCHGPARGISCVHVGGERSTLYVRSRQIWGGYDVNVRVGPTNLGGIGPQHSKSRGGGADRMDTSPHPDPTGGSKSKTA